MLCGMAPSGNSKKLLEPRYNRDSVAKGYTWEQFVYNRIEENNNRILYIYSNLTHGAKECLKHETICTSI